jgi:hypothetical protein
MMTRQRVAPDALEEVAACPCMVSHHREASGPLCKVVACPCTMSHQRVASDALEEVASCPCRTIADDRVLQWMLLLAGPQCVAVPQCVKIPAIHVQPEQCLHVNCCRGSRSGADLF